LGAIIGGYKSAVTNEINDLRGDTQPPSGNPASTTALSATSANWKPFAATSAPILPIGRKIKIMMLGWMII
jgi:hypothetical protein